jgi:hypothetical protein
MLPVLGKSRRINAASKNYNSSNQVDVVALSPRPVVPELDPKNLCFAYQADISINHCLVSTSYNKSVHPSRLPGRKPVYNTTSRHENDKTYATREYRWSYHSGPL